MIVFRKIFLMVLSVFFFSENPVDAAELDKIYIEQIFSTDSVPFSRIKFYIGSTTEVQLTQVCKQMNQNIFLSEEEKCAALKNKLKQTSLSLLSLREELEKIENVHSYILMIYSKESYVLNVFHKFYGTLREFIKTSYLGKKFFVSKKTYKNIEDIEVFSGLDKYQILKAKIYNASIENDQEREKILFLKKFVQNVRLIHKSCKFIGNNKHIFLGAFASALTLVVLNKYKLFEKFVTPKFEEMLKKHLKPSPDLEKKTERIVKAGKVCLNIVSFLALTRLFSKVFKAETF